MRTFQRFARCVGLFLLAVMPGLGCAASTVSSTARTQRPRLATERLPPPLPVPMVLVDLDPVVTLDPFAWGLPVQAGCSRPVAQPTQSVSESFTVDPFCLPSSSAASCASPAKAGDEDGIVDPFCSPGGNGS